MRTSSRGALPSARIWRGEDAGAIVVESRLLGGVVLNERGDGGHLHGPPGRVIVAAPPFVDAVLTMREPLQVLLEPLAHGGLVLGVPGAGLSQELHALDGADQAAAIEDSFGAAGVHVGDGLGVFQVGIHARFRIDEPGIDQAGGALGIAGVVQIKSGGAERKDRVAHGIESRAVGSEAVGVGLTIAAGVGAGGVGGVGPPVGGFAVVVVEIEIHALGPLGSDGPGTFPHAPVGVGAQTADGILRPCLLADDGAVDGLRFILRDQRHRNVRGPGTGGGEDEINGGPHYCDCSGCARRKLGEKALHLGVRVRLQPIPLAGIGTAHLSQRFPKNLPVRLAGSEEYAEDGDGSPFAAGAEKEGPKCFGFSTDLLLNARCIVMSNIGVAATV